MNKKSWLVIGVVVLVAFGIYYNSGVGLSPNYKFVEKNSCAGKEITIEGENYCLPDKATAKRRVIGEPNICEIDNNNDGVVDINDLLGLISYWEETCSSQGICFALNVQPILCSGSESFFPNSVQIYRAEDNFEGDGEIVYLRLIFEDGEGNIFTEVVTQNINQDETIIHNSDILSLENMDNVRVAVYFNSQPSNQIVICDPSPKITCLEK